MLREVFSHLRLLHHLGHEVAPERLPSAGAALLVEVTFALEGAEQTGRQLHWPLCLGRGNGLAQLFRLGDYHSPAGRPDVLPRYASSSPRRWGTMLNLRMFMLSRGLVACRKRSLEPLIGQAQVPACGNDLLRVLNLAVSVLQGCLFLPCVI